MARTPINRVPKKGPRKGVIIVGLMVVLGAATYHFVKSPPRTMANGSEPSASTTSQNTRAEYKATLPDLEINWSGGIKRDLFDTRDLTPKIADLIPKTQTTTPDVQLAVAAEAKSKIRLQGILNGPSPTALINDGAYHVGERISGFLIIEIFDNQIFVERQGVRLSIISE
jgi:hypothetical protein